jgi:hypothetical protein
MFAFTRFYLRVLADLNEIIRQRKRNVILTITIGQGTFGKRGVLLGKLGIQSQMCSGRI